MLNRVLRYTPDGFEYEADPRQAEKLLEGLTLDGQCNGAATPGLKPLTEQLLSDAPLPTHGHTEFRGLAARANYLSADRIELQFSAKELCVVKKCVSPTADDRFIKSHSILPGETLPWAGLSRHFFR